MQLGPDEAALALGGQIAPSLRARSSSYYWRHTSQQQARHEAVCSKRAGWHLRSFGSHGNWAQAAKERCERAVGVDKLVKRRELDSCTASSLESLPETWRLSAGVNNATRGAGWWRWKPYYLLQELRAVPEGDVIVHMDYDLRLEVKHPKALWCIGQNERKGVATFHFPCLTDRAWTKVEVGLALGATPEMLDTATLYAGLVVVRRTPQAEAFLQEWLDLVLQGDLATDALASGVRQDPSFVEHRHDQSVLSLLAKKRQIKSFPLPTQMHDVRDVWAWEAGYCHPSFDWPLPSFRPPVVRTKAYPRGAYITCAGRHSNRPRSQRALIPPGSAFAWEKRPLASVAQTLQGAGTPARLDEPLPPKAALLALPAPPGLCRIASHL